jgi:hypothetical protein
MGGDFPSVPNGTLIVSNRGVRANHQRLGSPSPLKTALQIFCLTAEILVAPSVGTAQANYF